MSTPRWPLPLGHVFGPSPLILTHHTGKGKLDAAGLRLWQARFNAGWRRPWMHPNGVFDAMTQRAVLEVQATLGLPRTGLLGAHEWRAVWESAPPPPKPKPPRKQPAKRQRCTRKELAKRRAYWERYSQWDVQPGSDPDAPSWYPGRPFGPHNRGDHVTVVQEALGRKPTGVMSVALSQRIAGLQRAHGLPESGVVDSRTAQIIEHMRT